MYYHRVSYVNDKLALVLIPKVAQTALDATINKEKEYSRINIPDATFSNSQCIATFVRNPYDRLLSVYKDKILKENKHFHPTIPIESYGFKKGMSFDRFVRRLCEIPKEEDDRHFRSQVDLVSWAPRLDFIGYYERIGKDWDKLALQLGLNRHLKRKNQSKKNISPYTQELRKMIADRYLEDFERFGYQP